MIKFLKKYENKSFEDLVNGIIWQDLPFRLKAILAKVNSSFLQDAPEDGKQYARKDGEWNEVEKYENLYSNTEVVIGEWVDTRPIYRNVIPFTIVGATLTIDITTLTIDEVINSNVIISHPDGKKIYNTVSSNGGNPDELVIVGSTKATDVEEITINSYSLTVSTGTTTAYSPNSDGVLILEYTKITV